MGKSYEGMGRDVVFAGSESYEDFVSRGSSRAQTVPSAYSSGDFVRCETKITP